MVKICSIPFIVGASSGLRSGLRFRELLHLSISEVFISMTVTFNYFAASTNEDAF